LPDELAGAPGVKLCCGGSLRAIRRRARHRCGGA
jgi:hypothetical protein